MTGALDRVELTAGRLPAGAGGLALVDDWGLVAGAGGVDGRVAARL